MHLRSYGNMYIEVKAVNISASAMKSFWAIKKTSQTFWRYTKNKLIATQSSKSFWKVDPRENKGEWKNSLKKLF